MFYIIDILISMPSDSRSNIIFIFTFVFTAGNMRGRIDDFACITVIWTSKNSHYSNYFIHFNYASAIIYIHL